MLSDPFIAQFADDFSPDDAKAQIEADRWEPLVPLTSFNPPKFPVDALPSQLGDFVRAVSHTTQTPADLAGAVLLSVLATTVAGKVKIKAGNDWFEPLNLFTVVSLPPGSRKSAVFSLLTRPLIDYERTFNDALLPEIEEAKLQHLLLDGQLKKAIAEATKAKDRAGRDEAEAQTRVFQKELSALKVPVEKRLFIDDCTPERLVSLLEEQEGRLAILSAEGGVFDMMSGRYSEAKANLDVYLKGHAGDTLRVDRVSRPAEYVPHPALSVGITVQPTVLRGLAARPQFRGRGLMGRFLYALPVSNLGYRQICVEGIPLPLSAQYTQCLQRLLDIEPNQDEEGKPVPHVLFLTYEAEKRLEEYRAEVEKMLRHGNALGDMTDWGGKLCGAVARIAGLLWLADDNALDDNIDCATMENAIILGNYFLDHARIAYTEMGMDEGTEGARTLIEWIVKTEQTQFTKRDAYVAHRAKFKQADDVDRPLEILLEYGYICPAVNDAAARRGRPASDKYDVNPAAHKSQKSHKSSLIPNSVHCVNSVQDSPDDKDADSEEGSA